jgi:hypothetical protein
VIRVPEGFDRGAALYAKYPHAITTMCNNRKHQSFDSPQHKGLKNRVRQMDAYIDNAAPAVSTFISDITPPVIRKAYMEFSSVFGKFLETDPLFSVRRKNGISAKQEQSIQAVLSDNIEKTYYREKCLYWNTDHIVRYGTAFTYTFAVNDYNANALMTIKDENEFGTFKQVYGIGENAAISTPVHPLNAIVDPRSNFMVSPDYLGFLADISISNLSMLMDNPAYVAKNLKEILSESKKGLPDEHWFGGNDKSEVKDFSRGHSNIVYLWTKLPIEGNEDDPTWYAVEMIGGKIIRIEENTLDGGVIPLAISRILPRPYTWCGNSPLESKICIQNLMYWLINMQVESTARLMDRMVLYREGSLDVEAINSRHQTGGFVPYGGQEPDLSRLIYSPQLPNVSYREVDWMVQEMRREDQDTSAMPSFNPQNQGGPTNKTLGGAQMMASIGEMLAAEMIKQYAVGLKDIAKHQLCLIRAISGDVITLSDGTQVPKEEILGNVSFTTKISNVYNYMREAIDSQNRLTQLINFKATKLPEFAAIKTSQFIEDWTRNNVKRENIEDYVDTVMLRQIEQNQMQAASQPPAPPMPPQGAPMQGAPQQGPPAPPPGVVPSV